MSTPGLLRCPDFDSAKNFKVGQNNIFDGLQWWLNPTSQHGNPISDQLYQQALQGGKYSEIDGIKPAPNGEPTPSLICYIPIPNNQGDRVWMQAATSACNSSGGCPQSQLCYMGNDQLLEANQWSTCTSTDPNQCQVYCPKAVSSIDGNWNCKTCEVANGRGTISLQNSSSPSSSGQYTAGSFIIPFTFSKTNNVQYQFQLPDYPQPQTGTVLSDSLITFPNDTWFR